MIINEMFTKPIDRDMKGVIKVGQADEENTRQELEEYVVTRELQKHFRDFFSSYKRGLVGNTDKMGVWISGFFGSGKSHFLKILDALLANKIVDGKTALQYFEEDHKIADPMVLADMKMAADHAADTDAILFNIDSKSEQSGKQDKDAIVSVFLKVFNEMQGFCGTMPYLADLERKLTEKGQYEAFCKAFEEINGGDWKEARYDFGFIQDDIMDALEQIGFMSHDAAQNWCEKAMGDYSISIEGFADLVRKYIESKGSNHHVVFLVDEIGQYIGDDSRLMLNLQTVTEDLGTACRGKAWIIVTSQQDIDSITKTKGNDFSKIQGRFDTRLALSSANVEEVIRKRILEKTKTAEQTLTLYYDREETVLRNLLLFNDGIEKKLYANGANFSAVYPFVPYQFDILGDVLTAIRTHGASGKHLASGERSMLALFKESASKMKEQELGRIVPFYLFYDALERFLDSSHSGVISRAKDNSFLQDFDVQLLKVLFMIKYVKEIRANKENLTTLMVSSMRDDRLTLMQKVEDALKRLTRQTLVQRNGDGTYTFLTDEEQEINRAIDNLAVDPAEITQKVSEVIFDDLYDEKKYRYPALNGRYTFPFAQIVDGKPYKPASNAEVTLRILTPDSDELGDDSAMRLLSAQTNSVLMVLPEDRSFLDETRAALKIEKFLRGDAMNAVTRYEQIKEAKKIEMRNRQTMAHAYLEDALKEARIYISGSLSQSATKEVHGRINEALGKLVGSVYNKLSYIDTPMTEQDIGKLFKSTGVKQVTFDGAAPNPNSLALADVGAFISGNALKHMKTSMKTLTDRFTRAPYGFVEQDVQWLAAKLFADGEISFTVSNEPVTLQNRTTDELVKIVTRKEYLDKLLMMTRRKVPDKWKKEAKQVLEDLLGGSEGASDEDAIMAVFLKQTERLMGDLDKLEIYYGQHAYPGHEVLQKAKKQLNELRGYKETYSFFEAIDRAYDDLLDLAEDYQPVRKFFEGDQKKIFDAALATVKRYDEGRNFFNDPELDSAAREIRDIVKDGHPFGKIYRLPALIEKADSIYKALLAEQAKPIAGQVAGIAKEVTDIAMQKKISTVGETDSAYISKCAFFNDKLDDVIANAEKAFERVSAKIAVCGSIVQLAALPTEAKAQRDLFVKELNGMVPPERPDDKPVKTHKYRTIHLNQIQIESTTDIEKFLNQLRTRLAAELEENTVTHIDF